MLPLFDAYLRTLRESDHASATCRDYRTKLGQFDRWLAGRAYGAAVLPLYRDHCQRERAWRPRTIRLAFCALAHYTRWLKDREPERFAEGEWPAPLKVRLPRLDPPERAIPSDRDVQRLFEGARGLPGHTEEARRHRARTLAALTILAYSGLRRSELLALDVRDVQEGDPWRIHVRCGKGRQIRLIPLGDPAPELLRQWLDVRGAWAERCEIVGHALFPVDRRRPRLSHEGLTRLWRELLDVSGLARSSLTPHCLRHWFGTCVAEVEGWETASELLGHADLATTARYLHTNDLRKRRAVESLGRRLSAPPTPERGSPDRAAREAPAGEEERLRGERTGDGKRFRRAR